jgi:hypothetical protein
MHLVHSRQVFLQRCDHVLREHRDAVFVPFPLAHEGYLLGEIDIFDTQTHPLEGA